jgi:hypothetical protein
VQVGLPETGFAVRTDGRQPKPSKCSTNLPALVTDEVSMFIVGPAVPSMVCENGVIKAPATSLVIRT